MKSIIKGKELTVYAERVKLMGSNQQLFATHVSLFTAIFVSWQRSGFNSPFSISRRQLMSCSRIAAFATYHKCIKELVAYGYIRYEPSYHPIEGSLMYWPENMP